MNQLESFEHFIIAAKIFLLTLIVLRVLRLNSVKNLAGVSENGEEKEPPIISSPENRQPFFDSLRYSVPFILPIGLGSHYGLPVLTIGILAALPPIIEMGLAYLKYKRNLKSIRSSQQFSCLFIW